MIMRMRFMTVALLAVGWSMPAGAQDVPLMLYDGETGTEFAGCLNCSRYASSAVCNRYGEFGSRYSNTSIWNRYGQFGSRYETNSPWNRYGEGLRVVDQSGNYYGRFTLAIHGRSSLPLVQAIIEAYEQPEELGRLRDALCD